MRRLSTTIALTPVEAFGCRDVSIDRTRFELTQKRAHSSLYKIRLRGGFCHPAVNRSWILKIVVDQVVLQKPFDTETVPFPPFMMPLINATEGLSRAA
ncbi:MAG: hypothetical protein CM15mP84_01630 [Cellvibrionales bacterium]|nr:MAG: hypothetical protein CM15mP84_01630 [Cellvibrionales bacterium]